jgi:hypothetical protein
MDSSPDDNQPKGLAAEPSDPETNSNGTSARIAGVQSLTEGAIGLDRQTGGFGNARVTEIFGKRYSSAPTGRMGVSLVTLISLNNDHRYIERIEERLPIHARSSIESSQAAKSDFSDTSVTRPLSVCVREPRSLKVGVTRSVTGCRTTVAARMAS